MRVSVTVIPWLFLAPALFPADLPPFPSTAADGAKIEVVYDETESTKRFFEGPTYDPRSDTLYFTAFGRDGTQILKLASDGKVSVFLDKSEGVNGTYLSLRGDLLGCQGDAGKLVRISLTGDGAPKVIALADGFEGKPFAGKPNDLSEDARGGVYFTCPDFKEMKASVVYYLAPDGKLQKVIDDMPVPNGVYVAKGGRALYVSDSEAKHVRVFNVNPVTGAVDAKSSRVFLDPSTENKNSPDGMTLDERGNLYATGRGGVWIAAPDGKILGHIPIPEFCSNVTFGGKDGRTLYFTCQNRLYRLAMKVPGWEHAKRHTPDENAISFKAVVLDKIFRAEGAAIADLNGDTKPDVIAGDLWYENPSWAPHEIRPAKGFDGAKGYSECFGCFSDDVNGDGFPDYLMVPFPGAEMAWYENPKGKPEPWKKHELWHSACNETPLFTDILGNGKRAMLMGWQPPKKENEGNMSFFTRPDGGQGKWTEHAVSEPKAPGTFRFAHGLGAGDVNGDGRADVIITDGWWEAPADAERKGPWAWHPAPFGPGCADMIVYDVNKDGLSDILTSSAHEYGIWWHEQKREAGGKTSWTRHTILESFSQSHAMHFTDLNGDGVLELVTGKRYFAHMGNDPGEFEPIVLYAIEIHPGPTPRFVPRHLHTGVGIATQFAIGDLNGDGLLDIAVGNKRGVHALIQEKRG